MKEDFEYLETVQNQLMMENFELRQQLDDMSQFKTFVDSVNRARKDVQELRIALECLSKGEKVGWQVLLGIEEPDFLGDSKVEQTAKNFEYVKNDVRAIKRLIADIYAHHCGDSVCHTQ